MDQADLFASLGRYSHGDRPLSLLDQIQAGTLDLELAAWLVSHVSRGASFIVGASPGRAGKSTTMRSLLSFVPSDLAFAEALPGEVALDGRPTCVICHELSDHPPAAYLWGQDLRDYFSLIDGDHVLVANLHADDLDGTRDQICGDNGVPEAQFNGVDLFVFLRVEGEDADVTRTVESVHFSDGSGPHRAVYTRETGLSPDAPRDASRQERCRGFLEQAMSGSYLDPLEVRERFLSWEMP
ncbi:hypothetical protein ACFL6X_05415 [Candidatus Latescibacterota bacterium]